MNPDDFDKLADSLGLQLTDSGVGALGEVIENIATQILRESAKASNNSKKLDLESIISTAKILGIKVELSDSEKKVIKKAEL
ncbi:MAG: hypothetical protein HY867_04345 [Chloroflexi bacterium]|nr:hypothetical protein [Chloroflexota bacterium]